MVTELSSFREQEEGIRHVRIAVFVDEQGIPADEEFDEDDHRSVHALVTERGGPVGTGRLRGDGRIGRVAVLREARGRGVGKAVVLALEQQAAAWDLEQVWVHAQVQAIGFYEGLGFRTGGDEFMEDRVPHRLMRKPVVPGKVQQCRSRRGGWHEQTTITTTTTNGEKTRWTSSTTPDRSCTGRGPTTACVSWSRHGLA